MASTELVSAPVASSETRKGRVLIRVIRSLPARIQPPQFEAELGANRQPKLAGFDRMSGARLASLAKQRSDTSVGEDPSDVDEAARSAVGEGNEVAARTLHDGFGGVHFLRTNG